MPTHVHSRPAVDEMGGSPAAERRRPGLRSMSAGAARTSALEAVVDDRRDARRPVPGEIDAVASAGAGRPRA